MHPLDPWRVANLLIQQQYGADAGLHAAGRGDALRDAGGQAGFAVWRQIIGAIDVLQRERPVPGEAQHQIKPVHGPLIGGGWLITELAMPAG